MEYLYFSKALHALSQKKQIFLLQNVALAMLLLLPFVPTPSSF
jgi:hypothetical protein